MTEQISPDFSRPTDPPLPGPRAAPPSRGAAKCSSSISSSARNSAINDTNFSDGDEGRDTFLSISSASNTGGIVHQQPSVCSSSSCDSSINPGGGRTDDSAVHRTTHDSTGHGIAHGTGGSGIGGERSNSGSMAPRSDQAGDTSSLRSSPPSSSPCGLLTEDDESSSDGHKDDEKEEEGGVETAVDKVVELFEQGQQAQQKIVVGVVQQGDMIQRLGRQVAQSAYEALQKNQQDHDVATDRVKLLVGNLAQRLTTRQEEGVALEREKNRLLASLRSRELMTKSLNLRLGQISKSLNEVEETNLTLKRENQTIVDDKKRLEDANRTLQADVAFLDAAQKKREDNPPVKVAEVYSQLKVLEANQEKIAAQNAHLFADNERLEEVNRGLDAEVALLTKKLAIAVSSSSAIVANDQATSDPPAALTSGSSLEIGRPGESVAATSPVQTPSPADPSASKAATGAVGLDGPVVTLEQEPSSSPAATAARGESKAAYSCSPKTPSRPRPETARPTGTFAATCPEGEVVPSPAVVATPLSKKQTPAKARKPATGEEDMSKCPFFNLYSPLVERELNAVYRTPRRYPRRPLSALSLNSGGKGAAGRKTPPLAARTATKPALNRSSSTSKEAPSLAASAVTKPSLNRSSSIGKEAPSLAVRAVAEPALNRSSSTGKVAPSLAARAVAKPVPEQSPVEEEVPSLAARAVTKPSLNGTSSIVKEGPSLAAQGKTGGANKQGSVATGPAVKGARGGGARTDRLAKAKGAGGGGKVEVVASGRVLRSASRAAVAAAAAAAAAVMVGGPSPVQPIRSTRSTTRRPAPKTTTTGRGVNGRGRYMSF